MHFPNCLYIKNAVSYKRNDIHPFIYFLKEVRFMSNYFDNQSRWSWTVTDDKIQVETDHGDHMHHVGLEKATLGDLMDKPGQTLGNAHRAVEHDYDSKK